MSLHKPNERQKLFKNKDKDTEVRNFLRQMKLEIY